MTILIRLALLIALLNFSAELLAQTGTPEEVKAYLCKYKWRLRRLEQDGKYYTPLKEEQGSKMIFTANGKVTIVLPSEKESEIPAYPYSLTKDKLTMIVDGEKTLYKYRLEDFIGYKLYLTSLDEEDGPTYVWEQAEEITTAARAITTKTSAPVKTTDKGISVISNETKAEWHMYFTKEATTGKQYWCLTPAFPETEIDKKWKEGYFITDLSYAGSGTDKWFLTMDKTSNFSNQAWRKRKTVDELSAVITDIWQKDKTYGVTHISFIHGEWILVMSKRTEAVTQHFFQSKDFPQDKIVEYLDKGLHVTELEYGEGGWAVVVSKNSGFSRQVIRHFPKWDAKQVTELEKASYFPTELGRSAAGFYTIFSKDEVVKTVSYSVSSTVPTSVITPTWNKGYSIQQTFYIPKD